MALENSPNPLLSLLPIFSAIIAFLAAIIGGYVAHRYSARRDRENERRKQRSSYLLEAFLLISKSINDRQSENSSEEIEAALVNNVNQYIDSERDGTQ